MSIFLIPFYLFFPFAHLVNSPAGLIQINRISYQNPVFEPVLADPSLILVQDEFFAYGTEDNWGEEGGYHLVPVIKSKDLVHWELVGNAFDKKPDWKSKGGIWAPDVTMVGNQFYMYYSFSTWGDPNPGIGLAIADKPEGPFLDQGPVFTSEEIGVSNSIDPFFIKESGENYLIWGSFHGLFLTKLSEDGKKAKGTKIQLAGNHLEAAYVHHKNGYYYLFGSAGTCCEGAKSTYRVLVGRSRNLEGPYLDHMGKSLMEEGAGKLVLTKNNNPNGYVGPGHNSEIVTDAQGEEWFIYHAMYSQKPKLANGVNRRVLMLDKILWENDWPTIKNQEPSIEKTEAPVF